VITEDRVCLGGVHTQRLSVAGEGTPIALLHGFADGADTWRALLAEFDAADRAAFAIDMPGFGRADPRQPDPILPQLDAFIDAVIADTGPVILMGNSLGACVSVRAAARGSCNVRGAIARLLYADPARADPAVLARFAAQASDLSRTRKMLGDARSIALETAGGYDSESVKCPLLVIHGRKDRIIPVHASERLHESVPASTLVVLPNSGHCPQLDDPSGLAKHVLRFLEMEEK
jgi:pimeloyl-ACP methyl ester carboxylesterase